MGNICSASQTKHGKKSKSFHPRDYEPDNVTKKEDLDHAVAKEETTTSYENITKIYNFKKELGHGHFGTVRLATLLSNPSQKFAIKAIEKQKMKKDLYLFKREVQILRKIDHPNVIKFYETYQDDRFFYLVQEYCSGGELLDRIAKEGRLSEDEVLSIMQKAFSAIKHLHTLGIVHRDLKPENFLLSVPGSEGEIKIIDFGLSKFLGDVPGGRLKTAVGTALYMAPEILKKDYDERCDNWSLGVLMYVLLSGAPPFEGDNANAVFQRILKGKYSFQGAEWKKISSQAKDLISGLLVVNPDDRLSATEALEHVWFTKLIPTTKTKAFEAKYDDKALAMLKNLANKCEKEKGEKPLMAEIKRNVVGMLSEAEMKEYRNMFSFLDKDNTGFVSIRELEKALKEAGLKDVETHVKNIVNKVNPTGNKTLVNYTGFLVAVIDEETLYTKERVLAAFKKFDLNQSGNIAIEDIKQLMARSGRRVTDNEVKKMIEELTSKKDGKISLSEFKEILGVDENP